MVKIEGADTETVVGANLGKKLGKKSDPVERKPLSDYNRSAGFHTQANAFQICIRNMIREEVREIVNVREEVEKVLMDLLSAKG